MNLRRLSFLKYISYSCVFLQIYISFLDIVNAGEIPLRNSDKVKVSLPLAEFERLQEHDLYGSWNSGMEQVNPRKT